MVAQIRFHLEINVVIELVIIVAQSAAKFFAQAVFRQIGDVTHHTGYAQAAARQGLVLLIMTCMKIGVGDDGLARHIIKRNVLCRQFGRRGNDDRMTHTLRHVYRPLHGLHAAQAAPNHCRPLVYAKVIGQTRLGLHPVFDGNHGEIGTIGFACFWIEAQRPTAAMAAAQIVQPNHKKCIGIDGLAWANHIVPPATVLIGFSVFACHMVVARQGVANQDRIAFGGIQCAIRFHHQIKTGQHLPILQRQRLFKCNFLWRYHTHTARIIRHRVNTS